MARQKTIRKAANKGDRSQVDGGAITDFISLNKIVTRKEAVQTALAMLCAPACFPATPQAVGDDAVNAGIGSNEDPKPGPAGAMPYEMAGRREPHLPLFDFQDVTIWIAEGQGVDARLYRTQEQRLWRPYAAKVVYRGTGAAADASFVVRPKDPLPLLDPWDCFEFWGWGNGGVSAIFEGADGKRVEIGMGSTDAQYWFLLHAKIVGEVVRPAKFVGLRFHNAGAKSDTVIYLGPGYVFQEVLKPLTYAPWSKKLPFPTRAETILPLNKTKPFTNAVHTQGDEVVFSYTGRDGSLEYRYKPTDATLGDIVVVYNGKRIHPCAGGGVQFATPEGELSPTDPAVKRELLSRSLTDGKLTTRWRLSAGTVRTDLTLTLHILQKSLIVDMAAADPVLKGVSLGQAEGVSDPQLFRVPYLTYGGNDPHILSADGLFFFTQFDWYQSDASVLHGSAEVAGNTAQFNGGAEYKTKTDGTRNPVRERLFLNVSPDVQEVLPTIPNPPSPMHTVMADRLWRVKHGENYAAEIAETQRFAAYGMDRVACRYHEEQWRDGDESFTFRLNAAPGRGGDSALQDLIKSIKSVGWLYGLYTNYTDFAPVNANWDPDRVSRTQSGGYYNSWWRCYAPKPMYAVEAAAYFAPRIAAKFGTNHSYCDVHTAVTPFSRVDYDARVPGAGKFRRVFACFGRILYEQKFAYNGPVYSEGNNHWWYAGLVDGNYAQLGSTASWKDPLFVDFDLLHMHPLSMDAGMGEIGMYYRGPLPDLAIERFRAVTLAYGHLGYLDYLGPTAAWPELIKTYYLQQPLQRHYVMVPVKRIEYADENGTLMESSRALVTGAYRNSRVHVVYESGFEVWVNGSDRAWQVPLPDGVAVLPAWGYVAHTPDGRVISVSALHHRENGTQARVDYCLSPDMLYLDSRGAGYVTVGPLGVDGAVALKRQGKDWWVIPATSAADIGVEPARLGFGRHERPEVTACAEDGSPLPAPSTEWRKDVLHILPGSAPAFKYRLLAPARGE